MSLNFSESVKQRAATEHSNGKSRPKDIGQPLAVVIPSVSLLLQGSLFM